MPYSCLHCNKSFFYSNSLKDHERTHTSSDFNRHEKNHTGENPFSSSHCDKKLALSKILKDHEKKVHTASEAGCFIQVSKEEPLPDDIKIEPLEIESDPLNIKFEPLEN